MGDECNLYNFRLLPHLSPTLVTLFKRYEKCLSHVKADKLILSVIPYNACYVGWDLGFAYDSSFSYGQ